MGIVLLTDEDIEQSINDLGIAEDGAGDLREALRADADLQRQKGQVLGELGFEVVEVSATALPGLIDVGEVLPYGYKDAINPFLAGLGDQVEVDSLKAIIDLNAEDLANRAPYGQGHLVESQESDLGQEGYLALKEEHQTAARDGLHSVFAGYGVDVLLSDVGQLYAPAGFPAITVPAGYDETGQPFDIVMVADYLGEPELIAVAYAYEQATSVRREPDLEATIAEIERID